MTERVPQRTDKMSVIFTYSLTPFFIRQYMPIAVRGKKYSKRLDNPTQPNNVSLIAIDRDLEVIQFSCISLYPQVCQQRNDETPQIVRRTNIITNHLFFTAIIRSCSRIFRLSVLCLETISHMQSCAISMSLEFVVVIILFSFRRSN